MTAPDLKEGNNPLFVGIAVAVVAGIIGFFTATYTANYGAQISAQNAIASAQANEITGQRLEIEHLKIDDTSTQASIASLNAAVSQFGGIKSAVEAQTHAFEDLQKKVDAIDHWLRPDPTPGPSLHSR